MSRKSSSTPRRTKAPLYRKPHPDFPLTPHPSGRWCKRVCRKLHYFGKIDGDQDGQAALSKWLEQKDDLLAGRTPRESNGGLTVADLCNHFLTFKQQSQDAGVPIRL
jgi:hypothetical protein